MRVFVCAFEDFSVAIPIRYVSSIMLRAAEAEIAVSRDDETRNTYFSLPYLFDCPGEAIKHGIVLKTGSKDDEPGSVVENKNILLSPEVEYETDIPSEEIYPLPKSLEGMFGKKSARFIGIKFSEMKRGNAEEKVVVPMLFLNPDQLVETTIYQLYRGQV